MTPLSDNDPFPFGKYKGEKMADVPASYLDWLQDQAWLSKWPEVADYIERNKAFINKELKDTGLAD